MFIRYCGPLKLVSTSLYAEYLTEERRIWACGSQERLAYLSVGGRAPLSMVFEAQAHRVHCCSPGRENQDWATTVEDLSIQAMHPQAVPQNSATSWGQSAGASREPSERIKITLKFFPPDN